jgi:tetratricopeptide (TPR) repeat protein
MWRKGVKKIRPTAGGNRANARLLSALSLALLATAAGLPAAAQQSPPPAPASAPKKETADEKEKVNGKANLNAPRAEKAMAVPGGRAVAPAMAVTYQREGDSLLREGKHTAAAAAYASAAASNPTDPLVRLSLGVMLAERGMVKDAIPNFRKAVQYAEDDVVAALLLQNALSDTGAGTEAQEIYLDTVRRFSRPGKPGFDTSTSVARLSAALKQYPQSPLYSLLLGDAYQLAEQWTQADEAYKKAIVLAPTWAKPWINLGLSRLAQGKTESAILAFETALKVDPRNVQARLGKGDAQLQAGQNGAAIQTYGFIASPKNRSQSQSLTAQAMTRIGQAYFNQGKVDDALNYLNKAQKIAPNDPAPSALIGDIQNNSGNYVEASSAYGTALRLTREGGLFPNPAQLYRLLAEAQLSARQPQRARETLQAALNEQPGNSPLWYRLMARAYSDLGQTEQAHASLRSALDCEQGPYPLDTLNAINGVGLLDTFAAAYKQELIAAESGVAVQRGAESGSGVSITMASPKDRVSGRRIPALVALAHIARYRNEFREEVRLRQELAKLRNNAWDWFLMGETYDLRLMEPANARNAYLQAARIGGLNDAPVTFLRQRLERLTAPAYKP